MHAALLSLVLMSGACGDYPMEEGIIPILPIPQNTCISVSNPPLTGPHGCAQCGNSAVPSTYHCCPQYIPTEPRTTPAWETDYHPAWYFYPRHRMFLDAADYTQPYPYRERFNYPWNDPRCTCAIPPIGFNP